MTKIVKISALVWLSLSAISPVAQSAQQRWTFDGHIHNNSLAISPDEKMAVASDSQRDDVIVYDLTKNKVRKILTGFITPRNVIFSPDGKTFYLSDSSLGVIKKFDSNTLASTTDLPAGAGAFGTAISKNGQKLYVNNEASNSVSVFDLIHDRTIAVITGFSQPRQGIKVSPVGDIIYVTNFLGDKISLLDAESNTVKGEITGFDKLRAISVSSNGKILYAANSGNNTIAVVDTEKREIVKTITVGKEPYGAALTADNHYVYSGNLGDNTLSVIDTESDNVVASVNGLNAPRQAIVFSKNNRNAYILNKDLSIAIVDLKQNRVVSTLKPDD